MPQEAHVDDMTEEHVDQAIASCLSLDKPQSFFLFAGAGSGKTRSLVKGLSVIRQNYTKRLLHGGRRVAVITYTNKAAEEISSRLEFDPLIQVSTIHHFAWSLIATFHSDIKQWLYKDLRSSIAELEEQQRKGRPASKAYADRSESIASKHQRLAELGNITRFVYSTTGDNSGIDSLNHSEVIKLAADFLSTKPLMQQILVQGTPILLIDESQDTNHLLMDAFLQVQKSHRDSFCLGVIGDTMQRIYTDGKADLGINLPADWAKPVKKYNHRSPRRIVQLINQIRFPVDGQQQVPRTDAEEGVARLFIVSNSVADKMTTERTIRDRMAHITMDTLWTGAECDVKTLILEHHMAAKRLGFANLFNPIYEYDGLRTGLLNGSLPELRLFTHLIAPLVKAKQENNDFAATAILRQSSPLLSHLVLKEAGADAVGKIAVAKHAVEDLLALWKDGSDPQLLDILLSLSKSGLFEIPRSFRPIIARYAAQGDPGGTVAPPMEDDMPESSFAIWEASLAATFSELKLYDQYVAGQASFDTHQGVKGLQFQRVLVIMDDTEARGFSFGYEKLFGAKDRTAADEESARDGSDSGLKRTLRLLYVTCSRAQKSLALVAYSSDPAKVSAQVVRNGWFKHEEIEQL